jgi:hypothetical protein
MYINRFFLVRKVGRNEGRCAFSGLSSLSKN